jgi:hypothetical protein
LILLPILSFQFKIGLGTNHRDWKSLGVTIIRVMYSQDNFKYLVKSRLQLLWLNLHNHLSILELFQVNTVRHRTSILHLKWKL